MISIEAYYRRAFQAARAKGPYVGSGVYQGRDGHRYRVRLFEAWAEAVGAGYLEEVPT